MSLVPVDLHPEAVAEARDAREWYVVRDPAAAQAFTAALEHAIGLVSETPERWPVYLQGTRRLLLRSLPFAVVYQIQSDRILVLAIAHQRQRPGYWRDR
jgi:plasmid stabilization system protein ParE